jgi:hypothetical protein
MSVIHMRSKNERRLAMDATAAPTPPDPMTRIFMADDGTAPTAQTDQVK